MTKIYRDSPVLAYDLGGTKVIVGVVDHRGKVLEKKKALVQVEKGPRAVFLQLEELGKPFLKKYRGIQSVGIASAGPLHAGRGELLDPTNLTTGGKSWGRVRIVKELRTRLRRKVILENDAAAAILAETWVGSARGAKNAMILTLGTGLGTGVVCNGSLVRAGRGLHTEAGHVILDLNNRTAPCGCGNYGCSEAFLSARNFGNRVKKQYPRLPSDPKKITELARKGNRDANRAFKEYAQYLATAIHNYIVQFCPEVIVLSGSFAQSSRLFLPQTKIALKKLLQRRKTGFQLYPKILVSKIMEDSGLLGGAYIAFYPDYTG